MGEERGRGVVRTLLPHEIVEAMHGSEQARAYKVLALDMTTARDKVKIDFRGNCVGLLYISAAGTPVKVRLNSEEADDIPFFAPGSVTRAFDEIYISHDAAAGVTAYLYLGWDLRT